MVIAGGRIAVVVGMVTVARVVGLVMIGPAGTVIAGGRTAAVAGTVTAGRATGPGTTDPAEAGNGTSGVARTMATAGSRSRRVRGWNPPLTNPRPPRDST
jgi:hypothetical protein